MEINAGVNKGSLAAGVQSSMAWMIYMAQQGVWDGDSATVEKLINTYMRSVIDYGVACCHHTCKNLAWNKEIIQLSSLTPAEKRKYAEILAQATNTESLYQMESENSNNEQSGNSSGGNGESNNNVLVNGTSQEKSDSSQDGGNTAFGVEPGVSGDAKIDSSSQNSQSSSGSAGANSYELNKKSASKSFSSQESNMPVFVILVVIMLIGIFLVGYLRNNDDEDDY